MGLFDDAGIDDAELKVSGKIEPGDYPGEVSNMEVTHSKEKVNEETGQKTGGDRYVVLSYALAEDVSEFPVQDWFRILPEGKTFDDLDDEDNSYNTTPWGAKQTEKAFYKNAYKQLKKRLMSIGVPENMVNKVGPDDLIGTKVIVSLVENKKSTFPKIKDVTAPGSSGTSLPSAQGASATATASPLASASGAPTTASNPFARK